MEKKELTLEELEKYSRKLNKENGFNCRHRAASLEAAKELNINLGSISSCLVGDLEELARYRNKERDERANESNKQTFAALKAKNENGVVYPEEMLRENASDNGMANMVIKLLKANNYWD